MGTGRGGRPRLSPPSRPCGVARLGERRKRFLQVDPLCRQGIAHRYRLGLGILLRQLELPVDLLDAIGNRASDAGSVSERRLRREYAAQAPWRWELDDGSVLPLVNCAS